MDRLGKEEVLAALFVALLTGESPGFYKRHVAVPSISRCELNATFRVVKQFLRVFFSCDSFMAAQNCQNIGDAFLQTQGRKLAPRVLAPSSTQLQTPHKSGVKDGP